VKQHLPLWLVLTLILLFSPVAGVWCAQISVGEAVLPDSELAPQSAPVPDTAPVFGGNLFQGNFSQKARPHFNPEYKVAIGDTIHLKIWGSFELELDTRVDAQGNIFIPKLGTVTVAGVANKDLVAVIKAKVYQSYNQKIFVYANIDSYQPVWVFATGNVNKPGLYQGMASDSVLQFIDKAAGINLQYGSFRKVSIVRNNQVIRRIDLYGFLTEGTMELFQFHDGDSIVVGDIEHRVTATGDVKRPFRFEFTTPQVSLQELLELAIPNATATNLTLTRWTGDNKKQFKSFALTESGDLMLRSGDTIEIYADHNVNASTITISGEHEGPRSLLVPKNYSLAELMTKLVLTDLSDVESIQLFRKSVAEKQKQLLLAKLQELETLVLTTSAMSKDEASMRSMEAQSILTFIERAKKVEPKGQIVIHERKDFEDIFLEEGDQVYIPRKNNIVLVQGEVSFPGAHTHQQGKSVADYIALAGDFGERANKDRVLLIQKNGSVVKLDGRSGLQRQPVERGDSILVLPKLEGKTLQVTKDITQILYQIAIGAGVLLAI
jgi:protein involved in polysaccharide export with SLBB domain